MGGWIKLHRRITDSAVWDNANVLKVWLWCLCKATHSSTEHLVGLQLVKLNEGQFVFGRRAAATELNMKESSVWKYMKLLETCGNININSNNKFSVVTVENWAFYQGDDSNVEQQKNNTLTTKKQQSNTNKNVKNVKKDNRGFVPPSVEEVKAYIKEKCYKVDAENFVDFYASKGWMVGKSKMKDWKACVRTWNRNNKEDYRSSEVKPKRYKEFEPVKDVNKAEMPEEMRNKLGGMFNYE